LVKSFEELRKAFEQHEAQNKNLLLQVLLPPMLAQILDETCNVSVLVGDESPDIDESIALSDFSIIRSTREFDRERDHLHLTISGLKTTNTTLEDKLRDVNTALEDER